MFPTHHRLALAAALSLCASAATSFASPVELPEPAKAFLKQHCLDCHDADSHKGNLDLTALKLDPDNGNTLRKWVTIHDRVRDGEMPPKKKPQPEPAARTAFLTAVAQPITLAQQKQAAELGRSTWRRLNRYEYENTLRDLLGAPWLQLRNMLPEDGESHRFNKIGEALDISHVQMSRYLQAAEYAIAQIIAAHEAPSTKTTRYYARQQGSFTHRIQYTQFNRSPERATFPIIGFEADIPVLEGKAPLTVGAKDAKARDREAMGVVASSYEPIEIQFEKFTAPVAGRYKIRFNAFSFWAGPESDKKWWKPDRAKVSKGRTQEPVTVYAETKPRQLRRLGVFDVTPEPSVSEMEVYLLKGEMIRVDACRLFRSRPPGAWHNPLAEKDGQPGVAYRWMEAEGPLEDSAVAAGYKLCFGELPTKRTGPKLEVIAKNPRADGERLLRPFMQRAYRRPVEDGDIKRFTKVLDDSLKAGATFTEAMTAVYAAVLCSPEFLTLEERPGRLDDFALAARLSYFLINSEPDAQLRALAAKGELHKPEVLAAQADRLIADRRSSRFVDAFLDYWIDLRKIENTSPDAALYPDYYLDDFLVESAVDETRAFFAELLRGNLPARNIVSSDFAMLNSRLAQHYGLPEVKGAKIRKVQLPADSVRGGMMTQASVCKITANGTTTSPVLRGAWIMERVLGLPPPPPPPSVPAVEPDTRGATTIREQLEKHRTLETCNSCHTKIDPAGFALESFDVLGGFRTHYRGLGDGEKVPGFGKNGQPFAFHPAKPVDASGQMPDGRKFQDIRELKKLLLDNERQIARNIASQLTVYATGAPIRFADRAEIEKILDRAAAHKYALKSLVHEIITSDLFLNK